MKSNERREPKSRMIPSAGKGCTVAGRKRFKQMANNRRHFAIPISIEIERLNWRNRLRFTDSSSICTLWGLDQLGYSIAIEKTTSEVLCRPSRHAVKGRAKSSRSTRTIKYIYVRCTWDASTIVWSNGRCCDRRFFRPLRHTTGTSYKTDQIDQIDQIDRY